MVDQRFEGGLDCWPVGESTSASMESSASGTAAVSVLATVALGIHVVRSTRHSPLIVSQSAEVPWPVAYAGTSA